MILCIAHTTNIGILFDSKDPYKYFDIKNLGFYSQKAANHPPHPLNKKKYIDYAPVNLLLRSL